MKKLIFLFLLLLVPIILTACQSSTAVTSAPPSVSDTPSTTAQPTVITTAITTAQTSLATTIQTPSTTTPEEDDGMIRGGFTAEGALVAFLFDIAYEMPAECSVLANAYPVTLSFGADISVLNDPDKLTGIEIEIVLQTQDGTVLHTFKSFDANEMNEKNYSYQTIIENDVARYVFAHSETFEVPVSILPYDSSSLAQTLFFTAKCYRNGEQFAQNSTRFSCERVGNAIVFRSFYP